MADPAAFVDEAVRRLAPATVVSEFAGADAPDLAREQIAARLLPVAMTLIRSLRAIEDLSTVAAGSNGMQRPLIRLRFADPPDKVLREQLRAQVSREAQGQWHAAVTATIRDSVDISVLVDFAREPRYVSLARWESSTSWLTQEMTAVLLTTVFARVRASLGGAGGKPALAFINLGRVTTTARPEVEILRSWGQHIVYLTAGHAADTGELRPDSTGELYYIVDGGPRGAGEPFSRIVAPAALASPLLRLPARGKRISRRVSASGHG